MSVFEHHLQYQFTADRRYFEEIVSYCQREIGDRTYCLNGLYGGQHWKIKYRNLGLYDSKSADLLVEVDDKTHATYLALKYS